MLLANMTQPEVAGGAGSGYGDPGDREHRAAWGASPVGHRRLGRSHHRLASGRATRGPGDTHLPCGCGFLPPSLAGIAEHQSGHSGNPDRGGLRWSRSGRGGEGDRRELARGQLDRNPTGCRPGPTEAPFACHRRRVSCRHQRTVPRRDGVHPRRVDGDSGDPGPRSHSGEASTRGSPATRSSGPPMDMPCSGVVTCSPS